MNNKHIDNVKFKASWQSTNSLKVLLVALLSVSGYFVENFIRSICVSLLLFADDDIHVRILASSPSPSRTAFPGCFITGASRILWVSYLLITAFESGKFVRCLISIVNLSSSVIFCLTLFRVVCMWWNDFQYKMLIYLKFQKDGGPLHFSQLFTEMVRVLSINGVSC